MARLAAFVHVRDAQGVYTIFGPADDVPTWAEALITNPMAWAEPPTVPDTEPAPTPAPVKKAAVKRTTPARRKAADSGTVHA